MNYYFKTKNIQTSFKKISHVTFQQLNYFILLIKKYLVYILKH